jgi:alpha-1,2-mannosyltransferase
MVDFEVNYTAGKRLTWGETLYRVEDEHYMFKYPPPAAILYAPISYLPLDLAKAVWYIVVILSSAAVIVLSRNLFPEDKRPVRWTLFLPFLVLARYFLREIELGQINALNTALLLIMTVFLIRSEKRNTLKLEAASGILWGTAVALKPYALIFFPYFILRKKIIPLLSGILSICLFLAAPALYYGWSGTWEVFKEWIATLSQSTPQLLSTQDNISIFAFFSKWTNSAGWAVYPAVVCIFGLALLILFIIKKRSQVTSPTALESSLLLLCIPLVSPLGWDYTLLMAFSGLMIILYHFSSFPKAGKILLIINLSVIFFSLYDIMGRELYASFMSLSVITVNFLILVFYLAYIRLHKIS